MLRHMYYLAYSRHYSCYNQSQMLMTHGNSKLYCISMIFRIAITHLGISSYIRLSLCYIKPIAVVCRP